MLQGNLSALAGQPNLALQMNPQVAAQIASQMSGQLAMQLQHNAEVWTVSQSFPPICFVCFPYQLLLMPSLYRIVCRPTAMHSVCLAVMTIPFTSLVPLVCAHQQAERCPASSLFRAWQMQQRSSLQAMPNPRGTSPPVDQPAQPNAPAQLSVPAQPSVAAQPSALAAQSSAGIDQPNVQPGVQPTAQPVQPSLQARQHTAENGHASGQNGVADAALPPEGGPPQPAQVRLIVPSPAAIRCAMLLPPDAEKGVVMKEPSDLHLHLHTPSNHCRPEELRCCAQFCLPVCARFSHQRILSPRSCSLRSRLPRRKRDRQSSQKVGLQGATMQLLELRSYSWRLRLCNE